ncbi:MAG TPA: response regulator transcription factor [Alphaproteobacteria bacterium]|mgnify:CR=1 FL=1|nr:response regulator transcription factor [Alphaproteobacteria bacterium]
MSASNPIRVAIVDDHSMVRRGLATILKLKPGLELVGEAGNGKEALDLCSHAQPDVVLMDLIMPEMDGPSATRAIRERWPRIQVIALTSFQEKELVREALDAGAIAYLLKNVTADDLSAAIHEAHAGRSTLAPEAIQALIHVDPAPALSGVDAAQAFDLTPREQEVLTLLIEGLTNPEIAGRLVVSRSTAKAHVSNILSKMGVSNRAEAISLALQYSTKGV